MDRNDWTRICQECRRVYAPMLQTGGRMPKGYRVCPYCKSGNTLTRAEERLHQEHADRKRRERNAVTRCRKCDRIWHRLPPHGLCLDCWTEQNDKNPGWGDALLGWIDGNVTRESWICKSCRGTGEEVSNFMGLSAFTRHLTVMHDEYRTVVDWNSRTVERERRK